MLRLKWGVIISALLILRGPKEAVEVEAYYKCYKSSGTYKVFIRFCQDYVNISALLGLNHVLFGLKQRKEEQPRSRVAR